MGKKIGIMGGTFNPIHFGHLLLAEQAADTFGLDEVLFIPSGNPYMKNTASVLDGKFRAEMTALALENHPAFHMSTMEIEKEGATYTCETLLTLRRENPDNTYYFIMGADNLLIMETWKNPEIILQNCIIVVAVRGTGTEDRLQRIASHLIYEYQADVRILPARFIDLSSSEIRSRAASGKSIRYMLPDKVIDYIDKNQLYREKSDRE